MRDLGAKLCVAFWCPTKRIVVAGLSYNIPIFASDDLRYILLAESPSANELRLLSGFGVVGMGLPDQTRDEGTERSLAPAAGVIDELEEAEIERQLFLRDAPVRAQPGA